MKRTSHTRANPSGLLVLLFLAGCSAGTNVVGSEHFAFREPMEDEMYSPDSTGRRNGRCGW